MRDVFEDIFTAEPIDPIAAARRAAGRTLRRRSYTAVAVSEQPEGFVVSLDGRPVRTPARRPLAAPTRALAEALAAEGDGGAGGVDPAGIPLPRLGNTIIDGVLVAVPAIVTEIEKYLGSDLVCY